MSFFPLSFQESLTFPLIGEERAVHSYPALDEIHLVEGLVCYWCNFLEVASSHLPIGMD